MFTRTDRHADSFRLFIGLAAVCMALGFVSGIFWPERFSSFLTPALQQLKQLAQGIGGSAYKVTFVIFFHNLEASFLFIVLGVAFGVFPVLMMWYNGLLMAYVVVLASQQLHAPDWKVFGLAMLPHGLFELPALVWSAALGIQLGFTLIRSITRRIQAGGGAVAVRGMTLQSEWKRVRRHIPWIVVLLLVAAVVESMVTPELIQWGL